MRTFLAIPVDEAARRALCSLSGELQERAEAGNFTRPENLHLTLAFLGENSRSAAVGAVMDSLQARAFSLEFNELGRFRRPGGDLCWAGAALSPSLNTLQQELSAGLRAIGFSLEDRKFTPHLTLGREVKWKPGVSFSGLHELFSPFTMEVTKFSLMKSERIRGVLTYTEIYDKTLKQ